MENKKIKVNGQFILTVLFILLGLYLLGTAVGHYLIGH